MTGFGWWLAERVSLLLEKYERYAALGDLAESGESGWQAFAGLVGLIARRHWRQWCPLLVATAMGLMLVRNSAWFIQISATYLWMYLANWRMADIPNSAFWLLMAEVSMHFVLPCLFLLACSLAAGVLLSFVRGRSAIAVFCVALAIGNLANVPREAFLAPVVSTIYAYAMLSAFVLLPAISGMRLMRHRLP